jgi:hypothetical protein
MDDLRFNDVFEERRVNVGETPSELDDLEKSFRVRRHQVQWALEVEVQILQRTNHGSWERFLRVVCLVGEGTYEDCDRMNVSVGRLKGRLKQFPPEMLHCQAVVLQVYPAQRANHRILLEVRGDDSSRRTVSSLCMEQEGGL